MSPQRSICIRFPSPRGQCSCVTRSVPCLTSPLTNVQRGRAILNICVDTVRWTFRSAAVAPPTLGPSAAIEMLPRLRSAGVHVDALGRMRIWPRAVRRGRTPTLMYLVHEVYGCLCCGGLPERSTGKRKNGGKIRGTTSIGLAADCEPRCVHLRDVKLT